MTNRPLARASLRLRAGRPAPVRRPASSIKLTYYSRHRAARLAYAARYYATNKPLILDKARACYAAEPQKFLKRVRAYQMRVRASQARRQAA